MKWKYVLYGLCIVGTVFGFWLITMPLNLGLYAIGFALVTFVMSARFGAKAYSVKE